MAKVTVRDIEVAHKRVLVRVDFNVPMDEKTGAITDDNRIRAALPTINYLRDKKAKIILCSHLGRPKGVVEKLRLAPIAQRLSELLASPVKTARDCIGPEAESAVKGMKDGEILLLENLRFHPEEERNDPAFARSLAGLAEVYVDDAFGAAHRAHASVVGVTKYLPSAAGLLLEKEINTLGSLLENPAHPFAALLGGAKVSDKVELLNNIVFKVDYILIGGGMAATFLKAKGYEIGKSLLEEDKVGVVKGIMGKAAQCQIRLMLPVDVLVAAEIAADAPVKTVPIENIPKDMRIVDIGEATIKTFQEALGKSKTVFWNGPMGIYEISQFAQGTKALAQTLASGKAKSVIGGGSTADAVTDMGLAGKMTFVSTGGGASLEFLSGVALPGIAAIPDKE